MIRVLAVENYRSLRDLVLELGVDGLIDVLRRPRQQPPAAIHVAMDHRRALQTAPGRDAFDHPAPRGPKR